MNRTGPDAIPGIKYWFGNRVVDLWNRLPRKVVDCNTVNSYKIQLDKYTDNSGWLKKKKKPALYGLIGLLQIS